MEQPTWAIDPVHSSAEFSLAYMGFTTYRTGFRSLDGMLRFDPAHPERASVTASIPANSVGPPVRKPQPASTSNREG